MLPGAAGPGAGRAGAVRRLPGRDRAVAGQPAAGDGIDGGFAPLEYAGAGRRLVAALKFSRLLVVAELGAALIADRAPPAWLDATVSRSRRPRARRAAARVRPGRGARAGARRAHRDAGCAAACARRDGAASAAGAARADRAGRRGSRSGGPRAASCSSTT